MVFKMFTKIIFCSYSVSFIPHIRASARRFGDLRAWLQFLVLAASPRVRGWWGGWRVRRANASQSRPLSPSRLGQSCSWYFCDFPVGLSLWFSLTCRFSGVGGISVPDGLAVDFTTCGKLGIVPSSGLFCLLGDACTGAHGDAASLPCGGHLVLRTLSSSPCTTLILMTVVFVILVYFEFRKCGVSRFVICVKPVLCDLK